MKVKLGKAYVDTEIVKSKAGELLFVSQIEIEKTDEVLFADI